MPQSHTDRAIMERVKKERELQGYNRQDIAEALNLTPSAYTPYEKGDTAFNVQQLFTLAEFFHKPITWFLGIDDPQGEARQLMELWEELDPAAQRMVAAAIRAAAEDAQRSRSGE